jgi:hypothetical protein
MNRRTLLETIGSLLIPSIGVASVTVNTAHTISWPNVISSLSSAEDNGLSAWLRLPMQPLLTASDVPQRFRDVASVIFAALPNGTPLTFHYQGGSTPGELRSVLALMIFQKIDPDSPHKEPADQPVYLLAFCQTRNAPRIFRLDRIEQGKKLHPF